MSWCALRASMAMALVQFGQTSGPATSMVTSRPEVSATSSLLERLAAARENNQLDWGLNTGKDLIIWKARGADMS